MKRIWIMFIVLLSFQLSVFGMQIKDQKGEIISFEKPYKRIISLYPAHAELISDLGGKDLLIGVSHDESLFERYKGIDFFTYHDNTEKFIAAKPDLILIRPMIAKKFKGLVRVLRQTGIQVVSLQPSTYKELPEYWSKIGKLIGKEDASKEYIKTFNNGVDKIKNIAKNIPQEKKQSIFFETRHKNFLTSSPDTMPYTIINTIGAINVASDAKPLRKGSTVAPYKIEKILSKGQNIDVFVAQKGAMNRVSVEDIYKTPGFSAIKAIQNKQVHIIPEDIISRPTKRLVEGMQYLGEIVYPQYFKK